MKIEQYLCGRKRYNGFPIGSNGDATAGFGCYCRTDYVDDRDIRELNQYFSFYICKATKNDGSQPTILSKTRLQSENIVLTAQSPVHTEGDRANTVSHCYIMSPNHKQAVDPEAWFGLPYYREDLNAKNMEEESRRQAAGIQIQLKETEVLPKGEFELKPLNEVMAIWNLNMQMLLGLLEGVIDSTRLNHHKVYISYDFEMTTEDDINQLLAWIYLMLPYGFRRSVGYDTLLNGTSSSHHIVFLSGNQLIKGNEICLRSYSSDGTGISEKLLYLEHAYLYDSALGRIIHIPSSAEIFGKKTPFISLLVEEIQTFTKCNNISECRRALEKYDTLFAQIDKDLNPFDTSVEIYDTELYFLLDLQDSSLQDLKNVAMNTVSNSEIQRSEKMRQRLRMITHVLEERLSERDVSEIWNNFLNAAVDTQEFPGQEIYVEKLANTILSKPETHWFQLLKQFEQRLAERTINGKATAELLKECMLKDSRFRQEFVLLEANSKKTWEERIVLSRKLMEYFGNLFADKNDIFEECCKDIQSVMWNKEKLLSTSSIKEIEYLLNYYTFDGDVLEQKLNHLVKNVLDIFVHYIEKTDSFQEIRENGITQLRTFYFSTQNTLFDNYFNILEYFYQIICEEWIVKHGAELNKNPELVYLILNAPKEMHITDNNICVENIYTSMKNNISWRSIENIIIMQENYPEVSDEDLEVICYSLLKSLTEKSVGNASQLDSRELAEAVCATQILYHMDEQDNSLYNLKGLIKTNTKVDFSYLARFSQEIDSFINVKYASIGIVRGNKDADLIIIKTEQEAFSIIEMFLPDIITRMSEQTDNRILDDFNQLRKRWTEDSQVVSLNKFRSQIIQKLDIYPSLENFIDFAQNPSRETAEKLEDNGFPSDNLIENNYYSVDAMLNSLYYRCPKKYINKLFASCLDYLYYKDNKEFGKIYNMLCQRLLDNFEKSYFVNLDYHCVVKLSYFGTSAELVAFLCSCYQNKKYDYDSMSRELLDKVIALYSKGMIDFKEEPKIFIRLLRHEGELFAKKMILLESPESIMKICDFLKKHDFGHYLSLIAKGAQHYERCLSSEDFSMINNICKSNDYSSRQKAEVLGRRETTKMIGNKNRRRRSR